MAEDLSIEENHHEGSMPCAHVYVCVDQKSVLDNFFRFSPPYQTGSHTEPEAPKFC